MKVNEARGIGKDLIRTLVVTTVMLILLAGTYIYWEAPQFSNYLFLGR